MTSACCCRIPSRRCTTINCECQLRDAWVLKVSGCAWLKAQGFESAPTGSAMEKVQATELLERAASETIQILGGYGLTADY